MAVGEEVLGLVLFCRWARLERANSLCTGGSTPDAVTKLVMNVTIPGCGGDFSEGGVDGTINFIQR